MSRPPSSSSLERFARRLLPDDERERDSFVAALASPSRFPAALVWLRDRPDPHPFALEPSQPWQPDFVDRVSGAEGPGRHPLHAEGAYYCLDASSVFAASVLSVVPPSPAPRLLVDLCASPGGKSVFAWRALRPGFLLANEVVRKRVRPLVENLVRCSIRPAGVVSSDPARLAACLPDTADVVLVDAPCSGQSLAAKGRATGNGFHPAVINLNTRRQRRILANAAAIVRPGGWLAYMTCTFSIEENERNTAWLLARFPDFAAVMVPSHTAFQSRFTQLPAYRLWPQSGLGAGAYAVMLRRTPTGTPPPARPTEPSPRDDDGSPSPRPWTGFPHVGDRDSRSRDATAATPAFLWRSTPDQPG